MMAPALPLHRVPTCLVAAAEEIAGAALSIGVLDRDGRVPGTFGTCFRTIRTPQADEIAAVTALAEVAAAIMEEHSF